MKKVIEYNGPAHLNIGKDKKGFYGKLSIKGFEVNTTKKEGFSEFLQGKIENLEGASLPCYLDGKILKDEGGNILASYENVFQKGKVLDLCLCKDGVNAALYIGSSNTLLERIPLKELPENLFERRKFFKVSVVNDEEWEIIRYANLHQHTEYSLLDGMITCKELAKKTEYSCAITDHGNIHGYLDFYNAMKKEGKNPIIGFEAYVETIGEKRPKIKKSDGIMEQMFDVDNDSTNNLNGEHLILLAKNETGLKNLFALTTESFNNFYKKPHVTYDLLEKYHEGVIATSACLAGTLAQSIMATQELRKNEELNNLVKEYGDDIPEQDGEIQKMVEVYNANRRIAKNFIEKMISLFGKDDFYIEYQDHHFELETNVMKEIIEYAKEYGLKITVGVDAHYLNEEDRNIHEMWLCNQTKKTMNDETRMKFSGDGYHVHSSTEMVAQFPAEWLDNTLEIADKCNVEIKFEGYHLPEYPLPEGFSDAREYLRHLSREGYKRLFKGTKYYSSEVFLTRMMDELNTIINMGWESYFLIVADFIAWAQDKNVKGNIEKYFPSNKYDHSKIPAWLLKDYEIYVGTGRGSGAGSLVCDCLGITKVNPIEYDLLFERFLSPDRISMPDIDTDFEDATREQVVDYCRFKYGEDHVSKVVTFGTAAAKNSIKDICRVNDIPLALSNKIAKMIPEDPGMTIDKALLENSELNDLYNSDKEIKWIIDNAKRIEGRKMNRSIHACAVCITDKPIVNYMPQILMSKKEENGEIKQFWTTQLTGPELEERGLLKMDFLGLRTLGVGHDCINLIKETEGVNITYDEIPINDVEVYKYLAEGNTDAVFQAESNHFTNALVKAYSDIKEKSEEIDEEEDNDKRRELEEKLGNEMFNRLADLNALVRPGPQAYIPDYCENIINPEKIRYKHPKMKQQLSQTYGIMLYQEQVMNLVKQLAGFSAGQADTIRKAMGKKKREILDEYKEYFINGSVEKNIKGCVANGISEDIAKAVWQDMESFAAYAFNKSHAVAYSLHSARTGWLAYYYPTQYMTAVLNSYLANAKKIKNYIVSCKKKGIEVLNPDVNFSKSVFTPEDGNIRFGLTGIKKVGKLADSIIEERERGGIFTSMEDFLTRISHYKVNKNALENLIYAGALDSFAGTRKDKIKALDKIVDFVKLNKDVKSDKTVFAVLNEFSPKFTEQEFEFDIEETEEEFESIYKLSKEDDVAGFYISGHPLDEFEEALAVEHQVSLARILLSFEDSEEGEENTDDFDGKEVVVAGVIRECNKRIGKNSGKRFYTFEIEDQTGRIKAVYFNPISEAEELMEDGKIVYMTGKVSQDDFGVQIMVKNLNSVEILKDKPEISSVECLFRNQEEMEEKVSQLKRALGKVKGKTPVYYKENGRKKVILKTSLTLQSEYKLKQIVGQTRLKINLASRK